MSDAQPAAQSVAQLAAQPDALLAAQPVQLISPVLRSSVRVPHKPSYLQSYHCNQVIGSFALTDPLPTKTGIAHPIQKFLSYSHLSPTHKHFCSSISPIVEPTSYA